MSIVHSIYVKYGVQMKNVTLNINLLENCMLKNIGPENINFPPGNFQRPARC